MEYERYAKQTASSIEPNPRQQDKIVAYFSRHNPNLLNQKAVETYDDEYQGFYEKVANNDPSLGKDIQRLLMMIGSPIDSIDERTGKRIIDTEKLKEVFSDLKDNRQMRGIVAALARHNMSERDKVNENDLELFYQLYPTPYELSLPADSFLEKLSEHNSPAKIDEYKESLHGLETKVYGKRFEYYQQIELLVDGVIEKEIAASSEINPRPASALWEFERRGQ